MTQFEFTLLDRLRADGPQTPGELGYLIGSPQLVTANLNRLARRGFVWRQPDGIWHLTTGAYEVLTA